MSIEELNAEQLAQVKIDYLATKNGSVSYMEMATIDSIVSDSEIFNEYSGVVFVEDDFMC